MSGKKQFIQWLLSEIPELKGQGIISDETAQQLETHYRERLAEYPSSQKIYSIVLGILGVVMAAAGIVLFLNHNWDMFPKNLRITLSALPLIIGAVISYFTIIYGKGQLWREVSAILTSTGTGTLIAVLSQIYHTGGDFSEFIFFVLLLSLPCIYIFNSIGLATLYVFFSFCTVSVHDLNWQNGLVTIFLLPYLLLHLRNRSSWHVWCRYLLLAAGISFLVTTSCGGYYCLLPVVMLCGIFQITGMDLMAEDDSFFKNPWYLPAFAVQTVILAIGSSTDDIFDIDPSPEKAEIWIYSVICALIAVLYLYLFFRKRVTVERCTSFLLILLTALPLVCESSVMPGLYNVYLGLSGLIFIYSGIEKKRLIYFNCGAVLWCVLACCRFFDSGIGLLERAGIFLTLGIGFIVGNWYFIQSRKEVEK